MPQKYLPDSTNRFAHPKNTKTMMMKKPNAMIQVAMARFKECANTAYVPVANANTIAAMANMLKNMAIVEKNTRTVKVTREV